MYAIRDTGKTLQVTFSGPVSTEEALRAVSQAFALADAGSLSAATCDLREITRGPGSAILVAAALGSRFRSGMRVGFIISSGQLPLVRRIARFSRIPEGLGVFESFERAESWVTASSSSPSSASRRHIEELSRTRTSMRTSVPHRHGAA